MAVQIPSLQRLLNLLQRVPFLASKNIYKVADHFIGMDEEKLKQFCEILLEASKNVVLCESCCVWKENRETCYFCESENRDARIICVVSSWHDLLAIEKTGGYKGMYHMLGGVISPLDGIGPEKLTISQLLQRVDKGVEELIITFNQTPEGEATAAFIAKKLEGVDINITCLARGMPIGSSLVYMDRLTIYKALSDRRPF